MTSAEAVRRLLRRFAPYRGLLALSVVLIAIHSAIPGALVFLIESVLDDVLIDQDAARLAMLPGVLVGLYLLNGVVGFVRGMLTRHISWRVVTTLRGELFARLLEQDIAWHQSQPTGALLARLSNDVNDIQYGVSGVVTAIQKPLSLLILIGSAFYLNPKLAAIGVVALPLVVVPIDRFGRRLRRSSRETLDNLAQLTASAAETLSGIRIVQAFGGEAQRMALFSHENELQYRLRMEAFAARLMPGPIIELIASVGVGAAIWYGGQQVFSGELKPGELVAFLFAMGLLNGPLKGLAEIQSLTQRAIAGAEVVFSVLDRPPGVVDSGTETLQAQTIHLRFAQVGFDYGDGPVLQDLDLEIPPGQVVALVGASGSGKSTAVNLIPRFYDPTAGAITINGEDICSFTLASLRAHISLVTQEGFLFNDTVANNIAFGTPADEAAIVAAARAANAHDFITALPHGYQTRIDELGMRLSGGQRQRIAIARAVLRDAPLLVLDEATSALDTASERLVQDALDRLARSRTVLAIAHRLSTIQHADEILVLAHGRVVERGRHAELMAKKGVYAKLVQRQSCES